MLAERAFDCLLLMFHQSGISKELFSGENAQLVVNILIMKFWEGIRYASFFRGGCGNGC